tara:strand:+ start:27550 stop:28509 length:960 start_codon:yes stop_codon:yes gene_type:complete
MAKRNNIDSLLGSLSDDSSDGKSDQDSSKSAKSLANPAIALARSEREIRATTERVPVLKLDPDQVIFFKYHDRHISSIESHKVKQLEASIKEEGQVFPGIVRKTSDKTSDNKVIYELISGRLRFEATKNVEVPFKAFLKDLDDAQAIRLMLIENEDRFALAPFERWLSVIPILEDDVLPLAEIAQLIKWDKANLSRYSKAVPFYKSCNLSRFLVDVEKVKMNTLYSCFQEYEKNPKQVESAISFVSENYPKVKDNLFLKAVLKRVSEDKEVKSDTVFLSGSKVKIKRVGTNLNISFEGIPKESELSTVIDKLRELDSLN